MITDLNRFLIALGPILRLAKEEELESEFCYGYYSALRTIQELAQDIHNGRNGY